MCRQQRAAGSASAGRPEAGCLKRVPAGRTTDRSEQAAWWKWVRVACGACQSGPVRMRSASAWGGAPYGWAGALFPGPDKKARAYGGPIRRRSGWQLKNVEFCWWRNVRTLSAFAFCTQRTHRAQSEWPCSAGLPARRRRVSRSFRRGRHVYAAQCISQRRRALARRPSRHALAVAVRTVDRWRTQARRTRSHRRPGEAVDAFSVSKVCISLAGWVLRPRWEGGMRAFYGS